MFIYLPQRRLSGIITNLSISLYLCGVHLRGGLLNFLEHFDILLTHHITWCQHRQPAHFSLPFGVHLGGGFDEHFDTLLNWASHTV